MARPHGVRRLFHHRFRKGWAEDGVDSEIRHHLELRTDELIEEGHHPDDAARLAEEAFGNIGRYRAQCVVEQRREARMTAWKKLALTDCYQTWPQRSSKHHRLLSHRREHADVHV